jgi:DNA-binding NarL/FixJ family response regulator
MASVRDTGLAPPRALLVEGSAVARNILERVLKTAVLSDLHVLAVAVPQDVPDQLDDVGVALVDIDLDDEAALSLIRRLPRRCWRLATTLYDEEERLLPALGTGVHGYLLKQDRYERQVEVLQSVLRGRPELSPAMARAALESLRQKASRAQPLDAGLEQALGHLGRGRSVKETARAMKITGDEVAGLVAHVYMLMHQPAGAQGAALNG